jgi:hypothetical protein
MMSPLGRVQGKQKTRRRGRRAWPLVTFVLIFTLIAGVVWWRVLNDSSEKNDAKGGACSSAQATTAADLAPKDVSLRVYNSTNRQGLAGSVGKALQARGLDVLTMANDPTTRDVHGVAEIRYGDPGDAQAHLIKALIPGGKMVKDTRTDNVVDLALGPKFAKVASKQAVQKALARLPSSSSAGSNC